MTSLHRITRVLLFVFLILPASASASGLIRLTDRDDLFGWEAVGRVEIGDEGYCTGVLIAPNLVLTAAHCVTDHPDLTIDADRLAFRTGLRDGISIAERNVSRVVAHRLYHSGQGMRAENIRHDAALLELDHPIPTAIASPFVLHQGAGRGLRVSVVSYGQGRDAALSWQRDCGVLGRAKGLMAFDCNVTYGSSGAPVFVKDGARARILSLISGGRNDNGETIAYGMVLPDIVDSLKRDLRAMPAPVASNTGFRKVRIGQGGSVSGAKFAKP